MEYESDADAILLGHSLIAAHLAVKTTSETRATTKSCVVISCLGGSGEAATHHMATVSLNIGVSHQLCIEYYRVSLTRVQQAYH